MLFKEWEEELAQLLLYWSMDLSEQEKVLILHIYGRIKGKKISFCDRPIIKHKASKT